MSFAFYKEVSFKGTPIGKIPKDWELVKLSDIAEDIYYGITAKAVENKTGLKMLRTTDIKDYTVDWDSLPFCEVTEKRGDIQRFLLKKGDLIIARAGTTGVSVLVEKDFENVIFGSYLIKVRLSRKVHLKFMRYFCQSRLYWDHITSSQAGSTLKNISLPVLRSLNVPLPSSIEEQQKIAEILSTIDEAIQKTNEIIAKTERLKKGLMQELLTKGIGHKEFKDTEIGRLPKDWEVVRLGDDKIAEIRGNKIISDVQKVAFIPMELVPDHGIFVKYEIRDLKDVSSSTYCEAGDLLLAKITPSLENGKQGIVPDDIPNGFALATTEVYPIVCKGIDRLFLFYVLKFPRFRKILEFSMRGTTGRQRVPKDAVERLKIPLPPYQEQKRIAEILLTFDKKLEIERNEKVKLERIKQGLLDLLLTGKIRVKV
jgi:type I restriction enzyme S subunit